MVWGLFKPLTLLRTLFLLLLLRLSGIRAQRLGHPCHKTPLPDCQPDKPTSPPPLREVKHGMY